MSSAEGVLSAVNFLTGEGVNLYPDSVVTEVPLRCLFLSTVMKFRVMTKTTTGVKVKQLQSK